MLGMPEHGHEPVMKGEVLEALDLKPGQVVMDCTVGRGGHALEMARKISPGGTLIAMDVDPTNLKFAKARLDEAAIPDVRIRTFHANFAEANDVLASAEIEQVDALLADFGVSTNQLIESVHGLSFNADAALDMRLDPRIKTKASDIVNEWDDTDISAILQEYAQERFAWKIAKKIVQTRTVQPILTTGQLANLVRSVVPPAHVTGSKIDPATRTFQALRMAVNSEMDRLSELLDLVPEMVKIGGRAAFISFHSGEDRLVKVATREWQDEGWCELLTKKPVEPSERECQMNPRSRSAKLRAVKFTESEESRSQ